MVLRRGVAHIRRAAGGERLLPAGDFADEPQYAAAVRARHGRGGDLRLPLAVPVMARFEPFGGFAGDGAADGAQSLARAPGSWRGSR